MIEPITPDWLPDAFHLIGLIGGIIFTATGLAMTPLARRSPWSATWTSAIPMFVGIMLLIWITDQPWTFAASLVWAALIALFTAQGRSAGTAEE